MSRVLCVFAFVACTLAVPAYAQSSVDATLTIRAFQSRFWSKFGPFEMKIATLPIESRWCAETTRLENFPWRRKFIEAVVVHSSAPLAHEIAKNEKDGTCTYRTIYVYSILLAEQHLSDDEMEELLEWQPSIHQASTGTATQATKPQEPTASPAAASAFAPEATPPDSPTMSSVPSLSGIVPMPLPQPATGNEPALKVNFCVRTLSAGSQGDDVKALQQFLAQDPAIYPEAKVIKTYGPATTRAVQRFQKKYNIVEGKLGFGVVGPKTCQVINTLSAAHHEQTAPH
jgi:hypothetical protein